MNISSYVSNVSYHVSQLSPSLFPGMLWDYYLRYLCDYQPNSWIARIASTSRILAVLVALPIIVLGLLDISSYGIARTLGVIDDVRASTSDTATLHQNSSTPSIRVNSSSPQSQSDSPFSDSDREPGSPTEHVHHNLNKRRSNLSQSLSDVTTDSLSYIGASQPHTFYASEDNNLKLSGVGVFSPAASQPPSPTIGRRKDLHMEGRSYGQEQDDGLRQRARQEKNAE